MSYELRGALLNQPISASEGKQQCAPNVWLSGEGMCSNFNGFVHGGIESGRREANRVLHAIGRRHRPPPPSLCDVVSGRLRDPRRPTAHDAWVAEAAEAAEAQASRANDLQADR